MAVVLVLVQVGLVVRDHILVVHAAREAARAAAVAPTDEAALAAAVAATGLDPARLHVVTEGSRGCRRPVFASRSATALNPRSPSWARLFPALSIEERLTVRVE